MSRRTTPRGRGFTLVEVVVAIALFAILMSLVYGVFGTAVRAHDAGLARTERGSSMRVVSEFLRNSIASAAAFAVADGDGWSVMLSGDAESLRYVVDLPGHVGDGGLHEIVVEEERADDGRQLVMRRRLLRFGDNGELEGDFLSRVLLPHSEGLAVRFFGSLDDEEPRWVDEWSGVRSQPLLVELAITPRDEPAWPVLRVHPRSVTVRYLGNGPQRRGATAPRDDESSDAEVAAPGTEPATAVPAQ